MKRIIPVDLVLFGLTRTSTSNQELLAPPIKNNFGSGAVCCLGKSGPRSQFDPDRTYRGSDEKFSSKPARTYQLAAPAFFIQSPGRRRRAARMAPECPGSSQFSHLRPIRSALAGRLVVRPGLLRRATRTSAIWPKCEVLTGLGNVRFWGRSGKHLLRPSSSDFDPTRTSNARRHFASGQLAKWYIARMA